MSRLRTVAVVVLRQVVKELLGFEPAGVRVVNGLGDNALEADVQRLPASVIVVERFGEITLRQGDARQPAAS